MVDLDFCSFNSEASIHDSCTLIRLSANNYPYQDTSVLASESRTCNGKEIER